MIKKNFLYILLLIILNGCLQSSVSFIGPAYTVASTGNIYQAGLTVTVNQTLLHATGENAVGHINKIVRDLETFKEKKTRKQNISKSKIHYYLDQYEVENNHQAFLGSVRSTIQIKDK